MNDSRTLRFSFGATFVALSIIFGLNTASALQQGRVDDAGVEVLTRGPVHEAFAETVTFNSGPGLVAPKVPPEALKELPPEQRPAEANVAWIPGYWAWDDERTDFLWVSGLWRALPPGRQWIPGYWRRLNQGAQWTSGYWADANASEIEYLPEPPTSVEAGPNIKAPSAETIWLPGSWIWQQDHYAWRSGYWTAGQAEWDWVPAYYVWTPRGYVYVDGYYDYVVARRGIIFAPVYFSSPIYARRDFSYSPATVINLAVFSNHLFLRPSYEHYYFGDYYDSTYTAHGFYPWFSYDSGHTGYDPFYTQQRWQHRSDPQWRRNLEANFANRRDHQEARPPRTWSDQKARILKAGKSSGENNAVAASLDELAKSKEQVIRLQTLDPTERQQVIQRKKVFDQFREQRQQLENQAADQSAERSTSKSANTSENKPGNKTTKRPENKPTNKPANKPENKSDNKSEKKSSDQSRPSGEFQRGKGNLPKSPIAAQSKNIDKSQIPPPRHEVPKPDSKVKPKPSKSSGKGGSPDGGPNNQSQSNNQEGDLR